MIQTLLEQISDNLTVFIYGYAPYATYGTSSTNLKIVFTH